MMSHLMLMELRLLLRKRITAFSIILSPILVVAITLPSRHAEPSAWARLVATNVLLLAVMSVYLVSLTVFTARRQSFVLKRLRTSTLSDRALFAGVLAPVVVVGLGQTVAYLVFCVVIGAPAPSSPLLVAAGVVLCVAVATALGVATACLSRSVESTQMTGVPVTMAAVGAMFLTGSSSSWLAGTGLLLPVAGPADLVARGWSAGLVLDVPAVPLDLASVVLWLAVAGVVFRHAFRWEPRA
jgi:ABC-2 type transport system permease protein